MGMVMVMVMVMVMEMVILHFLAVCPSQPLQCHWYQPLRYH
jgi:hypothetical protein